MLQIEEVTNSDAVIQEHETLDTLVCDVGFFRLWNSSTGQSTNLYIVLNSANDPDTETTIDSEDEEEMETLIAYAFRKDSINYEMYEKNTTRVFGDALHISPELIAKYQAYIEG